MEKYPALTDVPVFLMFFIRPKELTLSFNSVKAARPSKLILVSDGPRITHPNDKELNDKCKEIVKDIDWECEVYYKYSVTNKGMYVTAYESFQWAFTIVDRFIFLEEDVVPNNSFYKFCEVLLEKYKDDKRVHTICGMNHSGTYEKPQSDYFFSKAGSIWGFAIWKRTFEIFEYDILFNEDKYAKDLLIKSYPKSIRKHIKNNIEFKRDRFLKTQMNGDFELVNGASFFLQSGLMIIPSKNLISCQGISENAVHNVNNPKKLPKSIRSLFNMKTYELGFPLKHPKYIIADTDYEQYVYKKMGYNFILSKIRWIEGIVRQFFYSSNKERITLLKKILKKRNKY